MGEQAIHAVGLGKRYQIGQRHAGEGLRHVVDDLALAPIRAFLGNASSPAPPRRAIWALRDVTFDLAPGEVVGLIGRNGAGKSTLLKLLSRITEPTDGYADIRGRVASLLEVGTGFHPELTGRENVLLNGIILGMNRREIAFRFDEIVEFAGVERFIDTPVKRYSSGMQVRLAFAVAAHLQPEILLVDEVLAVGDAEFQRRCLGKMQDVTEQGRTIVFVSHNMSAIRALCSRTILLADGRVALDGDTEDVLPAYLNTVLPTGRAVVEGAELNSRTDYHWLTGPPLFRPARVAVLDSAGRPRTSFKSDEQIVVEIDYDVLEPVPNLNIVVHLNTEDGAIVLRSESADTAQVDGLYSARPGRYTARCPLPAHLFGEQRLYVYVYLASPDVEIAVIERIVDFEIAFVGYNDNLSPSAGQGYVRPQLAWEVSSR